MNKSQNNILTQYRTVLFCLQLEHPNSNKDAD